MWNLHYIIVIRDICQILIGASDWKDHSLGKEGAERYRIHNLPNCTSCPGVYELGVGISRPRLGRDERKLDSSHVVPVYLGQADNVRNRLQQYGREGAHLGNRCSNGEVVGIYQNICSDRGPGLFTEIFSKGFQIVYRWVPVSFSWFDEYITFSWVIQLVEIEMYLPLPKKNKLFMCLR